MLRAKLPRNQKCQKTIDSSSNEDKEKRGKGESDTPFQMVLIQSGWSALFLAAVVALQLVEQCDGVVHLRWGNESWTHDNLAFPLHDGFGIQTGREFAGQVAVLTQDEVVTFCALIDQYALTDFSPERDIDNSKFRQRLAGKVVLFPLYYSSAFPELDCAMSDFFGFTIHLLAYLSDAHVMIFRKAEDAAWNKLYGRAPVVSRFPGSPMFETKRAWLITSDTEALQAMYSRTRDAQKSTDTAGPQGELSMEKIDANPLVVAFDSTLYLLFYRVLFPLVFLMTLVRCIQVALARLRNPKVLTENDMYGVLGLNAVSSLLLFVLLGLDGYGSTTLFTANFQNAYRPLFYGLNSAADFLSSSFWIKVYASVVKTPQKGQWTLRICTVVFVFLDVLTTILYFVPRVPWIYMFSIVPAVMLLCQTGVSIFLFVSTGKLLRFLKAGIKKESALSAVSLVKYQAYCRLVFWVRFSILSSAVSIVSMLLFTLPFYFDTVEAYVFCNALQIVGRAGNLFAQVQICALPTKQQTQRARVSATMHVHSSNDYGDL